MSCDVGDDPMSAIFSQPHPGIQTVLLQTNTKLPFDSLMTALSKPFFHLISGSFWLIAEPVPACRGC
jgi:hypothetical protein